jgi:hypothetical protein
MPVNQSGGYSGRSVTKTHTGMGQDGISGTRTFQGQTAPQATAPQPPKTTGSAPTFQNGGSQADASKATK